MRIRIARTEEYCLVRDFYYELIDHIEELEYRPGWMKGIYPEDCYLEESISRGELFIGLQGDKIVSAMIVNTEGNESYASGKWLTDCASGEYMVIHALGVIPSYTRKGYAKEMVLYAIRYARETEMKSIRLDVLSGNVSAEKLYVSVGFEETDRIQMYYEDTGWTEFILYEYELNRFEVLRAEEEWQRTGAYSVRIEGMNRQHHISLREEFDEYDGDGTRYIVLLDHGYPVATCRFYEKSEHCVTMGRVVVLPEYRAKHLGSRVIREAERWISELGYREIYLESRVNAVRFYGKNGFDVLDDTVVETGVFDCIRMKKMV